MSTRSAPPPRGIVRRAEPPPGAVRHARFLAGGDLAWIVEHVWSVRWDLRGHEPFVAETLPHPAVHVVLERGASVVSGPSRRRFVRRLEGAGEVVGIKMRPGGFRPLVDFAIVELADRVRPLAELGSDWAALEADVLSAKDAAARVGVVEAFLRTRAPARDPLAEEASRVVDVARTSPDLVRAEDLATATGHTLRALQRLFRSHVGVSPKWVLQRYRLHEALARLEQGEVSGATLAHDLGYTDQAHFVRDFRALVGCSPGAYQKARASRG